MRDIGAKASLPRLSARGLGLVKAYNGWFTLLVALGIVAITNVVAVGALHAHLDIGEELVLEAVIVAAGVAIPVGLTLVTLWPELRQIFMIVSEGPPKATPILLRFVSEEMKLLGERIADTRSSGIDLEEDVVNTWIRDRCFAVASGPYLGTDSLVPSRFLSTYSVYLQTQADYLRRTGFTTSVRINLAWHDALLEDAEKHPEAAREYLRWHDEHGVKLLHLERARADVLRRRVGLGDTIDLAIWKGELALLVDYREDGATNLRLSLIGETSYRRCIRFFEAVLDEAHVFDESLSRMTPNEPPQADTQRCLIRKR